MTILIRRSPSDTCEFSCSFQATKVAALDELFDSGLSDFFPEVEKSKLTQSEPSVEVGEGDDQNSAHNGCRPAQHLIKPLELEHCTDSLATSLKTSMTTSFSYNSSNDEPSTRILSRSKSTRDLTTLLEDTDEEEGFIAQPLKMARLSLGSMYRSLNRPDGNKCSNYDDDGDQWGQFVLSDGADNEDSVSGCFWLSHAR